MTNRKTYHKIELKIMKRKAIFYLFILLTAFLYGCQCQSNDPLSISVNNDSNIQSISLYNSSASDIASSYSPNLKEPVSYMELVNILYDTQYDFENPSVRVEGVPPDPSYKVDDYFASEYIMCFKNIVFNYLPKDSPYYSKIIGYTTPSIIVIVKLNLLNETNNKVSVEDN